MNTDLMQAIGANLLSPPVLFFILGAFATLVKSDLKFPEPLYLGLTIYLLTSIGFKGGAAIAGQVGRPIASREQLRGVLPAPQWRESADEATVFRNGKYAVSIEAATGVILIAPQ